MHVVHAFHRVSVAFAETGLTSDDDHAAKRVDHARFSRRSKACHYEAEQATSRGLTND
jgi:hypothetical protein